MIPLDKVAGITYEHLFVVAALKRGLLPHMPVGDLYAHDVLLMNRKGGVARIQVKGTQCANSTRPPMCYTVRPKKQEFDFLAAYVEPLDAWWIIPRAKLTGITTTLLPAPKFARYRDGWQQLEGGRISSLQNMY